MLVTVNTDASFNIEHGVGGYAFWIISDDFSMKMGGVFKDLCENASDAEIKAIINALQKVANTSQTEITRIIVNTDCQPAIDCFNHGLKGKNKKGKQYWKSLKKKLHQTIAKIPGKQIKVEFRHVKAHNGTPDKRSYVNDWCDKTAKHFMKRAKNRLIDDIENF